MTEHDLTLTQDDDGWDVAECACGWTGPPCPGTEEAAGFWSDHVTHCVHGFTWGQCCPKPYPVEEHEHRPGGAIGCHHCRELTRISEVLTEEDYAYVRRLSESWSTRGEDNSFLKLVNAYDALKTDVAALRAEVDVQVGANSVLLDALRAIASDGCRSPSAQRADEWICLDDWPDVPEEWCAGCVAHLVGR